MRALPMVAASLVVFVSHDSPGALGRVSPLAVSFAALSGVTQDRTPAQRALATTVAVRKGPCPPGMVPVHGAYCIDAYEASLLVVKPDGSEEPWPYYASVPAHVDVRAVSRPGVYPQGYISGLQARSACIRSGKRLCKPAEWTAACMGPEKTVFPYGNTRKLGTCNDNGRSPMPFFNP